MGKRGPKAKPIDWTKAEAMAKWYVPQEDIAAILEISLDTLENRCRLEQGKKLSEFVNEKRATTRGALRAKQLDLALSGNVAMLIWCGKNILGQSDQPKVVDEKPSTDTVVYESQWGGTEEPKEDRSQAI